MARDDDSAQMMLLAAIVLIMGFVALSALVARVNQLPPAIARDQADPIFLEVEPLDTVIAALLSPGGVEARSGFGQGTMEFEGALAEALSHVAALEAGRGFLYSWRLCDGPIVMDNQAYLESTLLSFTAVFRIASSEFPVSPGATLAACA